MNIFRRDFAARLKFNVAWAVAMILFLLMCMAKFETITSDGGAAIQSVLHSFPSSVQAIYGMDGLDITTVAGYFGVCYVFILVMLAVHGGLLGGGLLAREEQTHTIEFLYTKPLERLRIAEAKMAVGLVYILIVWSAIWIGSVLAIEQFASMQGLWHPVAYMMVAVLTVQCFFFSIGLAAAAIWRRNSRYSWFVAGSVFGCYILYVISQFGFWSQGLKLISVFGAFEAKDILANQGLSLIRVALFFGLAIGCILLATVRFKRRDLRL